MNFEAGTNFLLGLFCWVFFLCLFWISKVSQQKSQRIMQRMFLKSFLGEKLCQKDCWRVEHITSAYMNRRSAYVHISLFSTKHFSKSDDQKKHVKLLRNYFTVIKDGFTLLNLFSSVD